MKLFLDESVPKIIEDLFLKTRTPFVGVMELGLSGSEDEVVFKEAQKRKRAFVTVDLKFVSRVFLTKKSHYGVILFRYKGKVSKELLIVIEEFIQKYRGKGLKNTLIVIDREKFRIRKLSY